MVHAIDTASLTFLVGSLSTCTIPFVESGVEHSRVVTVLLDQREDGVAGMGIQDKCRHTWRIAFNRISLELEHPK